MFTNTFLCWTHLNNNILAIDKSKTNKCHKAYIGDFPSNVKFKT